MKLFGVFDYPDNTLIADAIQDILRGNYPTQKDTNNNNPMKNIDVLKEQRTKGERTIYDAGMYIMLLSTIDNTKLRDSLTKDWRNNIWPVSRGAYNNNYNVSLWGRSLKKGKSLGVDKESELLKNVGLDLTGKTLKDLKRLFDTRDPHLARFFDDKNTEVANLNNPVPEEAKQRLEAVWKTLFEEIKQAPPNSNPTHPDNTDGENKMSIQKEIEDLINNGIRQIIFTGAPGTGKTYIAKKIAEKLGAELTYKKENPKYEFVQFHPSYDYTDFIEGLRPIQAGTDRNRGGNNIQFAKLDGIFKKFCREVVTLNNKEKELNNEKKLFFFIIDEINRADLSKVFGELMYCLEKDKRGKENRVNTQYQNLPTYDLLINKQKNKNNDVFWDGFYIPENVVIIGTMNDIDRSVESMDFALRRRFEWKEFVVNQNLLKDAFCSPVYGTIINNHVAELIADIEKLNSKIETEGKNYGLNRQYFISQGQFANLPEYQAIYDYVESLSDDVACVTCDPNGRHEFTALKVYVWHYRIESLLREYMRGNDENDIKKFIEACEKAFLYDVKTGDRDSGENGSESAPTAGEDSTDAETGTDGSEPKDSAAGSPENEVSQ